MKECERIISSIEHFHGHIGIESIAKIGFTSIEYKEDLDNKLNEINSFCEIINS
jgi:hypothetical protein